MSIKKIIYTINNFNSVGLGLKKMCEIRPLRKNTLIPLPKQ